jgi:hypothetical protein
MGYLDRLKAVGPAPQVNTPCEKSEKSEKSPVEEAALGDTIPKGAAVEGPGAPVTVRLHCGWCGAPIADGVVCQQTRCRAALERHPWLQPLRTRFLQGW